MLSSQFDEQVLEFLLTPYARASRHCVFHNLVPRVAKLLALAFWYRAAATRRPATSLPRVQIRRCRHAVPTCPTSGRFVPLFPPINLGILCYVRYSM